MRDVFEKLYYRSDVATTGTVLRSSFDGGLIHDQKLLQRLPRIPTISFYS